MPFLAKRPHRPWTPKPVDYNKLQGQGRIIVSTFYKSPAWKAASTECKRLNPFCIQCKKEGITKIGNVADHKKQINPRDAYDTQNGRYGDPLDQDNLQTMCTSHHNKKSAKERHGKTL